MAEQNYQFARTLTMKDVSEINRVLGIIEGLTYAVQDSGIADGLVGAVERIEAVVNKGGLKMANEKRLMKAWLVREKDEFCATVVFAETRGKARALALHTETCEDANFCDIEVNRMPALDKYYVDGKKEIDWLNSKDRVALVKDGGFTCSPDYWEPEDCECCPAANYCDTCQDRIKEMEEQSWI